MLALHQSFDASYSVFRVIKPTIAVASPRKTSPQSLSSPGAGPSIIQLGPTAAPWCPLSFGLVAVVL